MASPNALFTMWNHADQAEITGGDFFEAMPASNMQTRFLAEAARVDGRSVTFDVTLDTERRIQLAAILGHTCSTSARIRWSGYTDAGRTSLHPGADTGWQDMTPSFVPTADTAPEEENWLSGKPTVLQLDRFPRVWFDVLPAPRFLRYWRVEIEDPGNADAWLDLGRLFLSPVIQPSINFLYGSGFGWATTSTFTRSRGGVKFHDAQSPFRVAGLQLAHLPHSELYTQFLEMKRLLGTDREFFVALQPQNYQFRHLFSFQANFVQLARMSWDDHVRGSLQSFEIEEAL